MSVYVCACVDSEAKNKQFCSGQVNFEMHNKLDIRDVGVAREHISLDLRYELRGKILSLGFTSTYTIFSLDVFEILWGKNTDRAEVVPGLSPG